jgi:NAD(P)-dependent dehydrogenase (short-subunit alcohol dehydrogenase family)
LLLVGAESELGGRLSTALAEAGGSLALVSARSDAEAAYAVHRLARKLGAAMSQAIDATNGAAFKVMLRQVGKALGGLDAVVVCSPDEGVRSLARTLGEREMARSGGGCVVNANADTDILAVLAALPPTA